MFSALCDGVLLVIIGVGGVLVFGGNSTRGGDGLNPTFGRPISWPKVRPYLRPAEPAGRRYGRTFGRPIGRPKVRRADKYAEPIGTPNPGTVKSGGPFDHVKGQAIGREMRIERTVALVLTFASSCSFGTQRGGPRWSPKTSLTQAKQTGGCRWPSFSFVWLLCGFGQ